MTRTDQKILYNALAFLAVVMKGKDANDSESVQQIHELSGLIDAFCTAHVVDDLRLPENDADTSAINREIERHMAELRQHERTRLPEDRAALIALYDQLRVRKAQRTQREIYAHATEAKLADLVLRLLDEEIEDSGALT